jgi:hypothetical protein
MSIGRDEAIGVLEDGRARLASAISGMRVEEVARRATLGGGDWSVKDLIGHVGSWERRALEAIAAWERDEPFGSLSGVGGVDGFNAANVAASRRRSLERVRREADEAHRDLVARIRSLTDADWRSLVTLTTGRRHRLVTVLGGVTGGPDGPFDHASAHLPDVLAYAAELARERRASHRTR